MKKHISAILVLAIMIGIFSVFSFGSSANTANQYDLDDPEQRLAYEMTFVTGTQTFARASYLRSHSAELLITQGKAEGTVDVVGVSGTVTGIRIFMYIQRYVSGKWTTVYDDNEYFAKYYATMDETYIDSTAFITGYDYRISYTIYAYKGSTYQRTAGTSPIVR